MLEAFILHNNIRETILGMIELLAILIEVVVVLFIAYAVFASVFRFLISRSKKSTGRSTFSEVQAWPCPFYNDWIGNADRG